MKTTQSLRLSLFGAVALLTCGAPMAACATENKPAACVDNTPHTIRFVTVAPGVEVEVVDWGGAGETMVLLTGFGDNAHVYDQFAFQFTDYFHVIGITRRGWLPRANLRTATTFRPGRRTTSRSSMASVSTRPYSSAIPLPAWN
jgi:hypothetical protein